MFPETRRDAPQPAPQRIAASAAASRTCGWSARPEVVVGAQQEDGLAVEHHARPLRAADHAQAAIEAEALELVQSILQIQHVAPVFTRPTGARGWERRRVVVARRTSWRSAAGTRGPTSSPSSGGRGGGEVLGRPRRASRPRASPSGCRAAGSRRCRAGAAMLSPSCSNIAWSSSGALPSVVRKLPIITPLMPALTASCWSSPMFSVRPPQRRKSASGRISRKMAIHLHGLPRVHVLAVAELGPGARVEQVDRDGGRVDLGQLEGHLDALLARLAEVEDPAHARLQPGLADRLDRAQPALVPDRGGDLGVVRARRLDVVVDALDPGLLELLGALRAHVPDRGAALEVGLLRDELARPRGSPRSRAWRAPGPA